MILRNLKPFKPILIGLILFLLLNTGLNLLIAFTPVGGKLDQLVGNRIAVKVDEISRNDPQNMDVLALGTSMTAFGFRPQAFEAAAPYKINSFNMGIPGTRPDVLRAYLDYHIKHYGKPKVVLVEVSEASVNADDYYRSLHYSYLTSKNPGYWRSLLHSPYTDKTLIREMALSTLSGFYHYRGIFSPIVFENKALRYLRLRQNHGSPEVTVAKQPSSQPQAPQPVIGYQNGLKGWETKPVLPEMLDDTSLNRMAADMRKMVLASKETHLGALDYLLQYCQQQDIQVVLVSWPTHPRYVASVRNLENYRKFQTEVQRLSTQYQAPLITFDIPDTEASKPLFESGRHLSAQGADKMTRVLAQQFFALPQVKKTFQTDALVQQ